MTGVERTPGPEGFESVHLRRLGRVWSRADLTAGAASKMHRLTLWSTLRAERRPDGQRSRDLFNEIWRRLQDLNRGWRLCSHPLKPLAARTPSSNFGGY